MLGEDEADHAGGDEDDLHEVAVLARECVKAGFFLFAYEYVCAVLLQPRLCFCGG